MATYNLAPGFYKCKWQYSELTGPESTEVSWQPGQHWHTIGQSSGERLVKAVADFYQGLPGEFLITHNLGGSFKWRIQKVVGYNIVAWHCNGELFALWLRPLRTFDVNLAIQRHYTEYRLLVTNAETMQLIYVETKYKTWREVLKEVGQHMLSRDMVTDMEHDHDYIQYIYKGRKLRANQALNLENYDNDGNHIKKKAMKKVPESKNVKKSEKTKKKPAASDKKAIIAPSKK